ncbi:MAG TPA: hypothetical protein VGU68_01675 [Ktedonobacteraceae bacterium]|nr:hypothetical protein [Ktedonobacteraceae bacterium]HEV2659279.1 hypothetical protein [Ktedonobacteraceae bacterium]
MGLASILLPITRHVNRMDARPIPTEWSVHPRAYSTDGEPDGRKAHPY